MPRIPTDYSKTLIYKIVCKDLTITDLYVGNTTSFKDRKNRHKSDCKKKELLIYKTINNNGGWDNWEMIEIEKYPCKDGNEARTRERFWYEELNAKLNIRKPITIETCEKCYLIECCCEADKLQVIKDNERAISDGFIEVDGRWIKLKEKKPKEKKPKKKTI